MRKILFFILIFMISFTFANVTIENNITITPSTFTEGESQNLKCEFIYNATTNEEINVILRVIKNDGSHTDYGKDITLKIGNNFSENYTQNYTPSRNDKQIMCIISKKDGTPLKNKTQNITVNLQPIFTDLAIKFKQNPTEVNENVNVVCVVENVGERNWLTSSGSYYVRIKSENATLYQSNNITENITVGQKREFSHTFSSQTEQNINLSCELILTASTDDNPSNNVVNYTIVKTSDLELSKITVTKKTDNLVDVECELKNVGNVNWPNYKNINLDLIKNNSNEKLVSINKNITTGSTTTYTFADIKYDNTINNTFTCLFTNTENKDSNPNNNSKSYTLQKLEEIDIKTEVYLSKDSAKEKDRVDVACEYTSIGLTKPQGELISYLRIDDGSGEKEYSKKFNLTSSTTYPLKNDREITIKDSDVRVECDFDFSKKSNTSDETRSAENNNVDEKTINVSSCIGSGVCLKVKDVDSRNSRSYLIGELTDVECTIKNEGGASTLDDDRVAITAKVYGIGVDREWQGQEKTEYFSDRISQGREITYLIRGITNIPINYQEDEVRVSCKVEYLPDRTTNDRKKHANSGYNNISINLNTSIINTNINLTPTYIFLENPIVKGKSNELTCMIQNVGERELTASFRVSIYEDGIKIHDSIQTNDIRAFDTYNFKYNYIPKSSGTKNLKCEAYTSTDPYIADNTYEASFIILETQPITNINTSPQNNYTPQSNSNILPGINVESYLLNVTSISFDSYKSGNLDVICNYENLGSSDLKSYDIYLTQNGKIISTDKITNPLKAGEKRTYLKNISIGSSGGTIGCIIKPTDSEKAAGQNMDVKASTNIGYTLIAIVSLILIGILVYFILKYR